MEALIALFALGVAVALLAMPIVALVALARANQALRELEQTRSRLEALGRRVVAEGVHTEPPAESAGSAGAPRPESAAPSAASPLEPVPSPGPPAPAVAPLPPLPPRRARAATPPKPALAAAPPSPATRPIRPTAAADFATNLGPKILVGAGGLAFVVFLGFFVRYAWENNWVGPAGRVLSAAVFSLGLVALGLRIIGREYRPLGQGLAATGFAGLYITAFAAHAVYALVPRSVAAAFMIAVTACAVLVAERLDARLLAGLAWVGGYLAPVLLSTGVDRAVSLFAYLLLLGAGALWLDRRKPWPETTPIALTGTLLLYAAWYAAHFRPERFEVAAGGLVALTALFAAGTARKERPGWHAGALLVAVLGLSQLSIGADRPEVLLVLSLGLALAALLSARALGEPVALVAVAAVAVPYVAWAATHYRAESFGLAAAWVVGGALLLALGGTAGPLPDGVLPGVAVAAGGLASVGLAARTDRPAALLALLAAQALLAAVTARRWAWTTAIGASLGALAVLAWYDRYFRPERGAEALALGVTVAGLYVLVLAVEGFASRRELGMPGAVAHVVAAGLAWAILDRVLSLTQPSLLGPAAVGLGSIHLALGLAARHRGGDLLRVRVTLGLAAVFLTLAVPVQLGLHGITLAWAVEGVLLLWLGVAQRSPLTRAFGYGVLLLAVGRLFARHLPLHPADFTPLVNPAFGTWLAVILALAAAHALVRRVPASEEVPWLDGAVGLLVAPLGLVLLFGLLTGETQSAFSHASQAAALSGDADAALRAGRQGGLAVSVLWTVFATGLLAAGLGMRSRALFYAGYALFAVTASKVVLVDLATLPTLYRMLSFLALGVLLLAGAWLNLRFRERLTRPESSP
jgi:uncharacterized membrane protein